MYGDMGKVKNRNEMYYILESAKLDYTKNLPNQTILNYLRTRLCHPNLRHLYLSFHTNSIMHHTILILGILSEGMVSSSQD